MEHENNRLPIFTKRFKELQGDRSQTEFAYFLGISRQTVGFYYNGNRVPDALTLVKIAQKCNVSADYLLGLSDSKATEAEIKQICNSTGLSESAVEFLHSICEHEKQLDVISSVISHSSFPIIVDYILELEDAKIETECERWGISKQKSGRAVGGGRVVSGFEHELFLEYMIETCVKSIISEITNNMISEDYPVE